MSKSTLEQALLSQGQMKNEFERATESSRAALSAISGRNILKTKKETERIRRDEELAAQERAAQIAMADAEQGISLEQSRLSYDRSERDRAEQERRAARSIEADARADRRQEAMDMLSLGIYDPSFSSDLGVSDGVVKEFAQKKNAEFQQKQAAKSAVAKAKAEYEASLKAIEAAKAKKAAAEGSAAWYQSKIAAAVKGYDGETEDAEAVKGAVLNEARAMVDGSPLITPKSATDPLGYIANGDSAILRSPAIELHDQKATDSAVKRAAETVAQYKEISAYYDRYLTERIRAKEAAEKKLSALEQSYRDQYGDTASFALYSAKYDLNTAIDSGDVETYNSALAGYAKTLEAYMLKADADARATIATTDAKRENLERFTEEEREEVKTRIKETEEMISIIERELATTDLTVEQQDILAAAKEDFQSLLSVLMIEDTYGVEYEEDPETFEAEKERREMDAVYGGYSIEELEEELEKLRQSHSGYHTIGPVSPTTKAYEEKASAAIKRLEGYIEGRKTNEKNDAVYEKVVQEAKNRYSLGSIAENVSAYYKDSHAKRLEWEQYSSLLSMSRQSADMQAVYNANSKVETIYDSEGKAIKWLYHFDDGSTLPIGLHVYEDQWKPLKERATSEIDYFLELEQEITGVYHREVMNFAEEMIPAEELEEKAAKFSLEGFHEIAEKYRHGGQYFDGNYKDFKSDVEGFAAGDYGFFDKSQGERVLALLAEGKDELAFNYYANAREQALLAKADSLNDWWAGTKGAFSGLTRFLTQGGYMIENALTHSYERMAGTLGTASHQVTMEKLDQMGFGGEALEMLYMGGYTFLDMVPAVVMGTAGNAVAPGVGSAMASGYIFAKSMATTYTEDIAAGKRADEALTHGILSGAAEVAMDKILGGIPGLTSKNGLFTKLKGSLEKLATTTGAKTALRIASSMGAEGFEEFMQEVISPFLSKVAADLNGIEGAELEEIDWEEAGRSFLLGAITGGAFSVAYAPFENRALEIEAARTLQGGEIAELIDIGAGLGNKSALKIKEAIQAEQPRYKGVEGLAAFVSEKDIANIQKSIRKRRVKGAAKKLSGMIEANMEGADPAEIKRAKRIFRKVLTAQTLTMEEAATIAKDQRLLQILEGMMGEELLGKDIAPQQIALLARLASFTDENGKVSKARLALFKDAFGEIDTKAIEQILRYDSLTGILADGVVYESENIFATLNDSQQEAVETLNALSEMTGFHFLITENHKTGDYLASGLMAVNPADLHEGVFYAVSYNAYYMMAQLYPDDVGALNASILNYAKQGLDEGVVDDEIKRIKQERAIRGIEFSDEMAKDELCARMFPGLLLSGVIETNFSENNAEDASRLLKVFKAIQRHLYDELRNRNIKSLETEGVMNYNTTKVNSLGGNGNGSSGTLYNDGQRGTYLPIHNGSRGSGNVVEADSRRHTNADGFAGGVYTREGGNGSWGVDSDGKGISREVYERTKESAIRDGEGNLIAVYHATENLDFSHFLIGDIGFHFGTEGQAFYRAQDTGLKNGRIIRGYLNIKKAYDFGMERANWSPFTFADKMRADEIITNEEFDSIVKEAEKEADGKGRVLPYDSNANKMIRSFLERSGYDGVVYDNLIEGDGKSYIAFYDDQIIPVEESLFEAKNKGIRKNVAYMATFANEVGALDLINEVCAKLESAVKRDRADRYGWKNGEDTTKSDPLFDEIVAALHINDDSPLIGTLQKFVGTTALQKAGIKIDGSVGIYGEDIEQMKQVAKEHIAMQRKIRDYTKRNKLTDQEQEIAKELANGDLSREDAEGIEGIRYKRVKRLADLIAEKQGLEKSKLKTTFMKIKNDLAELARIDAAKLIRKEGLAGVAQNIAQFPALASFETPRRVFQLYFGLQNGAEVYARWYKPIEENNRLKNLFIGRHLETVREKLGGKWSRPERQVAQMLIEAQLYDDAIAEQQMGLAYQNAVKDIFDQVLTPAEAMEQYGIRDFDRLIQCVNAYEVKVGAQELVDKHKIDTEKLQPAIEAVKAEYAMLYDALNDFLVAHGMDPIPFIRYYTPHMQIDSTLDKFRDAIRRFGTQEGIGKVPVTIAGKTHEFRPNRKWNPHMKERTGNETDYDLLVSYQAYLNYFSNVIYHTDDIMRLRALEQAVRLEYSKENIKERYDAARKALQGTVEEQNQFLREVGEISGKTVLSQEDATAKINEYFDKLTEEKGTELNASRFATWLQDMANIRAGKQSAFDRGWEAMFERDGLAAFTKYFGRLKAGKVAGSISSLLKQHLQILPTIAKCGVRHSGKALWDIAINWRENSAFADEIALLVGKRDQNPLVEGAWSKVGSIIGAPMQWVDYMTSLTVAKAGYLKGIEMGMDDATAKQYANEFATKIMGSRQNAEKPRAFHSKGPFLQTITAFAVEAHNSVQSLTFDTVAEYAQIKRTQGRGAAMKYIARGMLLYFTLAFFGNRAEDELMNQTPIPFDLIGILTQGIAAGQQQTARDFWMQTIDNVCEDLGGERIFETERETQDFDVKAMFGMIGEEVLDDFIIPSNFLSTMGWSGTSILNDVPLSLREIAEDGTAMIKDPSWENALELFVDVLAGLPVPLANQIRKTAQGTWTIAEGGNYRTNSNGERQLLYPVTGWWDKAKTTVFGKYASYDAQKYFDTNEKPLSVKQTVVYDDLLASGVDAQTAYDTMLEFRKIKNDKGSEDRDAQRKYIDSLPMTDEQKMILFKYTLSDSKSVTESVEGLSAAGVSDGDIMDAYNEYREIKADETLKKEKDKATEFAYFLDRVVEDPKHRKMIKQAKGFTYGDFDTMPAEEYENMTEGGVSFDDAYEVYFAVSDLEPEGDKETVSTVAKYSAIGKCKLSDESAQTALLTYATESDERRMTLSFAEGTTAEQFISVRENLEIANKAAGKETASNARIRAAITATDGLTTKQRAILWQLFTSSTSAKNNPFSVSVGWETVAKIEAYKKAHED